MNQHLQNILNLIQQSAHLNDEEKTALLKAAKNADKELEITSFKLERTEKVKRTTAILLEETIEELENKRKAVEAQNKELEIESCLERVRTIAMSMNKPGDMLQVCRIISEQLELLKVKEIRNVQTAIFYKDKGTYMNYEYYARHDKTIVTETIYTNHAIARGFAETMLKGNGEFFITHLNCDEVKDWINYQKITNVFIDDYLYTASSLNYYWFSLGPVALGISTYVPLTDEEANLFKRFLKVFELSYRRYLDIEKAEAQAKEAQIELALERVRARTMAMQKSDELPETSTLLFQQLKELGETAIQNSIAIVNENAGFVELSTTVHGSHLLDTLNVPIGDPFLMAKAVAAWKEKRKSMTLAFEGQELKNYNELRNSFLETKINFPEDQWIVNISFFSKGWLSFSSNKNVSSEIIAAQKRFATVFEQTYTRFLDLQKAETQAREAQIETALERVRSRTMAMYHSDELAATVKILFEEFRNLQNEYFGNNSRGFITTINEEEKYFELWITEIDGSEINKQFFIEFEEKTTGKFIYKAWLTKQPYLISDLQGETLSKWLDYLSQTGFKIAPGLYGARRVNNFIYYSKGFIGITSSVPLSENSILLLQRFAKVFEQTYTRFLDLKNAEAREVIAIREASLDRVRGEIASMRTAEDLQRITPLVWRELTALGVPFFRCGLFIVDEPKEQIHFYLSTPDGKPLAALELDFKSITVTQEALANWRVQKVYTTHWSKEEFISFAKSLLEQGQIENTSTYQGGEEAPESLTLQFVPFKQGMLYVGSEIVLKEMHIESVKVLADAFSTAYARYEDFIKLELAKQQIEKALAELQATQKQLIQSEKMASLGELTAGIAHEIQNPLNFVNNFSEVNKEMLEELKAERLKPKAERDETLEDELINDVKDNSEKIHHHGKRAGDIVKGMLQHSRSGSGQKELTDINALCDEYLRLAYHGLRAKDKSFNATFETDFDASVDKINIVPQDIGRVILNLINNAFYAVGERRKAEGLPYEPTVTVSTKKIGDKVLISVQDNGTGIPPHIVDKIFQPFFTTKPTGQGTGLGLSLSYDIIKAHGGEIKVERREAEGTEFIIALTI